MTAEQVPISKTMPSRVLDTAIERATDWLLSRQDEDGHWLFELEADATIPAEYILLQHYLGTIDSDFEQRIARYLRATQGEHGGWPPFSGGDFHPSAPVQAYFSLKA